MAKKYPNLSTVLIFIVCVIVVASFFIYTNGKPEGNVSYADVKVDTTEQKHSYIITDETNWQKQFVNANTNSLKYSPTAEKNKEAAAKPLTLTDIIGRDFFTQYWQVHQAGLENDTTVLNNVSDRFADQVAAAINPTLYSFTDIKVSDESSTAAMVLYAKKLMALLKKFPTADPAIIANDALNGKKGASLAQIDPIIASYKTVLSGLKSLSVPTNLSANHLNLINSLSTMLFNAEALRKVDVDPVRGLGAISIYVQSLEQFSTSLSDLNNMFRNSGIYLGETTNI